MQEIAEPDTKVIVKKTSDALTRASELEIKDDVEFKAAGAFVQVIKDLRKEVDKTFDDSIEAAFKAHKSMIAAKNRHADPLAEAERITKWKMAAYFDEQERIRRVERERIEEENRKAAEAHRIAVAAHEAKLKAEAEAKAKAEADAARAALEAAKARQPAPAPVKAPPPPAPKPTPPPPPPLAPIRRPAPAAPGASGVSMVAIWKHEVVDFAALVAAVAAGTAPIAFLQPNDSALADEATKRKGEAAVEGVHFWAETSVRAR